MATPGTSPSQYVELARSLPPRLLRFFARYPPPSIQPRISASASTAKSIAEGELPGVAASDAITAAIRSSRPPKTYYQLETPNPFKQTKHPVTGKWHDPVYSLRRQAELVKLAREHGVESLLPSTTKGTEARIKHRVKFGSRVRGTGVGQQVKGHKDERVLEAKMEKRREAMLAMPGLIRTWRKVGKRRWKRWPKAPKGKVGSQARSSRR